MHIFTGHSATLCSKYGLILKLSFSVSFGLSFISNPNIKQSFVIFAERIAL